MSAATRVKECAPVVYPALEETVRDSGHISVLGKVLAVHLARARLRQDSRVAESPIVHMRDDKVPHLSDGAHEGFDWIELDRGLVRRLSSNSGSCHKGRKIRWKRSPESRMLHAEWAKYVLLHVVIKRKTRNGFDQV